MADAVNRNYDEVSVEGKIIQVMQIIETLDYPELLRLRDIIAEAYTRKIEEAKVFVIAEARKKFEQLGLTFEDVIASQCKQVVRTPAIPKYRSPEVVEEF